MAQIAFFLMQKNWMSAYALTVAGKSLIILELLDTWGFGSVTVVRFQGRNLL